MDPTIRLQALSGTWETCGADRAIQVVPESLVCTANPWGSDKASFDLRRSPLAIWPDIGAFTPVEVEIGGVVIWKGRTNETPLKLGAERVINVQCEGLPYHLDDDVYQRMYVHSKLSDWRDVRSFLTADLTVFVQGGNVSSSKGVTVGWAKENPIVNLTGVGVGLDLGQGQSAKRIVVEYDYVNNTSNGNQPFFIKAADTGIGVSGADTVYETNPGTGSHEGLICAATLTTARRYLWLGTISTAGGDFIATGDLTVRLRNIYVFADTAYEKENASVLKASTVATDAISRATMLLSSDTSQITATSFNIPDLDFSKSTTPREAIEAVNAYHNWIAKVDASDRLVFKPRPTDALLEIGAWAGSDVEDASANSGAEIYNRAIIEANGADGAPLMVERMAAQQTGVSFLAVSSPAPINPSFTTNTEGWEGVTRDTATFFSSPASGKWSVGISATTIKANFTGTFKKGVTYQLRFRLRWAEKQPNNIVARFGTGGDEAQGVLSTFAKETWAEKIVTWIPLADRTGVMLELETSGELLGTTTLWIDDLSVLTATPTLVDRHGFRRTKVIQVSSAITPAEGEQLATIFLEGHTTTPFKGSAKITYGGVRTVLGGQLVHPSRLLLHTQELIRLSHMIDPDTGGIGRDGLIANVTYTHKDQAAQVDLDANRQNFDALLARLAAVQGAGA